MRAVIGLGNPGRRYEKTRHNVGFEVLDALASRHGLRFKRSWRIRADSCRVGDRDVLLVKPQGYMNRSGEALVRLRRRAGIAPADMLVVVDDVALSPGSVRVRPHGGAGGHNGLRSVIDELGTDQFPRLRIGVGANDPGHDRVGHVLGRFAPAEREAVDRAICTAVEAVTCVLEESVDAAMNRYNARRLSPEEHRNE